MILENELIKLRAVEPRDSEMMWLVESDSEQWIQNGMSAPFSRQNLLDYALSYDADPLRAGQIRLIIENKSDNSIIGIVDLFEISPIHRHAFIGIYIMPDLRRKGYALEALKLSEEYAFKLLNIHHIAAKIMADNQPSQRLFKKAGYIFRGEIPDWFLSGSEYKTLSIYSKLIKT